MLRLMIGFLFLLLCPNESIAQEPYLEHNSSFGNDIRAIVGDTTFVYSWSLHGRFNDCDIEGRVSVTDSTNFLVIADHDHAFNYFTHKAYLTPRGAGTFFDTIDVGWGWNQSNCGDPNHTHDKFVISCVAIEDSGFYFRPYATTDTLRNDDAHELSRGKARLQFVNRSDDEVEVLDVKAIGKDSAWTAVRFDPAVYGLSPIPLGPHSTGALELLFETKNAPLSDLQRDTLQVISRKGDRYQSDTTVISFRAEMDRHIDVEPSTLNFSNPPGSHQEQVALVRHSKRLSNFKVACDDKFSARIVEESDTEAVVLVHSDPTDFGWNGIPRSATITFDRTLYNGQAAGRNSAGLSLVWSFDERGLQSRSLLHVDTLFFKDTLIYGRESDLLRFKLSSDCKINPHLIQFDEFQGSVRVDTVASMTFEIVSIDQALGMRIDTISLYAGFADTVCGYGDVLRLPIRYLVIPYVASVDLDNRQTYGLMTIAGAKLHANVEDGEWMLTVSDAVGRVLLHTPILIRNDQAVCDQLKNVRPGIFWLSLANRLDRRIGKVVLR